MKKPESERERGNHICEHSHPSITSANMQIETKRLCIKAERNKRVQMMNRYGRTLTYSQQHSLAFSRLTHTQF